MNALLATITLAGLGVVASKSPINSVILLVVVYLAGGCVFLMVGQYFLGLTLIIVYVGAIAILFLFTIFMVNVRLTVQKTAASGLGVLALVPILALATQRATPNVHELHTFD